MLNDRNFLSVSEALTRSVGRISGLDVVDLGYGGGRPDVLDQPSSPPVGKGA